MFLRDCGRRRLPHFDNPDLRGGELGPPLRHRPLLPLLLLCILVPASLAAAADTPGAAYVTSELSDTVAVVAGDLSGVIEEIAVGNRPHNLEATEDGLLIVATQGDNSLSVIDPANDPPTVRRIGLDAPPHDIAVAQDGSSVFVLSERGLLAQVDPAAGEVLRTVELGGSPHDLAAAAGNIWVTDISSRRIFAIDAEFSVRELPISIAGHGIALRPGSEELWITPWAGTRAVIVDWGTGEQVADLEVGQDPSHKHIAFTDEGGEAWVSEPASGGIFVVDASTRSVAARIDAGGHPHHVRFAGGRAYVAVAPNELVVLDARNRRVISRLRAGSGVHDVELVDPAR